MRLVFCVLMLTSSVFATCHVVTTTGSASNAVAADWASPMGPAQLAGTLTRGDVYYMAGGLYTHTASSSQGWALSQAVSGTLTITFRAATGTDHCTATNWTSPLAATPSNQVRWQCGACTFNAFGYMFVITSSYWVFDGNGRASKDSGYNMMFDNRYPSNQTAAVDITAGHSNFTFKNVEYYGPELDNEASALNTANISSIACDAGGATATVVLATTRAHNYIYNGQWIAVASVSSGNFNIAAVQIATNADPRHFTYPVSCTPNASVSSSGTVNGVVASAADDAFVRCIGTIGSPGSGCTNIFITDSYVHDFTNGIISAQWDTATISGTAFERETTDVNGFHAESWADDGSNNITFANNWFLDTEGTGDLVVLYRGGAVETTSNVYIYGNIFGLSPGNPYVRTGIQDGNFSCGNNGQSCSNILILNNTIIGDGTTSHTNHWGWRCVGCVTSTGLAYNNLAYNTTAAAGTWDSSAVTTEDYNTFLNLGSNAPSSPNTHDHVWTSVSDPFVNQALHSYLLAGEITSGHVLSDGTNTHATLAANDIDPLGNTRGADGTWDRGAYEFVLPFSAIGCDTNCVSGSFAIGSQAGASFGPPLYLGASYSTLPMIGTLAPLFISRPPSGQVNTVFPQTVNWAAGDQFNGGNCVVGDKILIIAILFTIGSCDSATQLHITGSVNTASASNYAFPDKCIGDCLNSCKEDLTIPGHTPGTEQICRASDGTTIAGGASVGNFTLSGGDNDHQWSYPNGTYLWYSIAGGSLNLAHIALSGGKAQVVNTGLPLNVVPGGAFHTSWLADTDFYRFKSGSQIWKGHLTSDTAFTESQLVDLMGAGVCPGWNAVPFSATWHSVLNVTDDDDTFTIGLGPTAQGDADWVFQWSRTRGCRTVNAHTGQYWAYCPSGCGPSTPAAGTFPSDATECYGSDGAHGAGIHDVLAGADSSNPYIDIAKAGVWTIGGCAGIASSGPAFVNMNAGTSKWCSNNNAGSLQCGAHESVGIAKLLTPASGNAPLGGPSIRPLSNLNSFTKYMNALAIQDQHCSWPHNNNGTMDDTLPWICASDLTTVANGGVYNPNPYNNEIMVWFTNGVPATNKVARIAHTFSCGDASHAHCTNGGDFGFGAQESIGIVSPRGDMFAWVSTHLGSEGSDSAGHARADLYVAALQ